MFTTGDEHYLIRAINQNRVILFLGAGSSYEATNRIGSRIPLSKELAAEIWTWLDYDGDYDNTPLSDMYQALITSGRPFSQIEDFLNSRLLCVKVPEKYDELVRPAWYRIYTTNTDNLLELIWHRAARTSLDILKYPQDDVQERDQLLNRYQAIYLHGKLPCRPDEVTFSTRQYARRAVHHDPLYDQFVRDYATLPVVFLGSELNEPLFWQYLEAREARGQVPREGRPKSFLISKRISPAKKTTLKDLNVIPIEAAANEFLSWISANASKINSSEQVLKHTMPTIDLVRSIASDSARPKDLGEFALAFHSVPITTQPKGVYRSNFLLGTTPRWEDILNDLDAPRTISQEILETTTGFHSADPRIQLIAILGSAGCGKSTILRRVGLTLAQAGVSVFLTNSEELPRPSTIARALDAIPNRVVLLFDNSEGALGLLPALVRELQGIERPPILLIAARTNDFDRKVGRVDDGCEITEFHVPNLDKEEIVALLKVLERQHLLGRLRGLNETARIHEFQVRSGRQILVAMREATTGRGFDEILQDEFAKLPTDEAKVLYLCTALATDAGYRIRRDELVGCASVRPAEALYVIDRSLRDIVLSTGVAGDLLLLRHRRIAEFMVDEAAPRHLLEVAYIRLLRVLAGQLGDRSWRSRTFGFYRGLVNHLTIYYRFAKSISAARDIYESLREHLAGDPHFWLQYGSLELEANVLDRAENYLAQAHSLDASDRLIKNATGHLLLRKAMEAETKAQAIKLRSEGSELLLEQILDPDAVSVYSFHIYCSQRLGWLRKWGSSFEERKEELEELREKMSKACKRFPRARELAELRTDIERQYLELALPER